MTHAISDNAKGCVALIIPILRIEVVRFRFGDVPLSIRRVWILTASHANGTIDMGKVWIYFQGNGLSSAAAATLRACEGIGTHLGTGWIAALNNEIINHTVEKYTIVNAIFDVGNHVLCRDWSPLLKQFNHDHSVGTGIEVSGNIRDFNFDNRIALIGVFHRGVFRLGPIGPHAWINAHRAPPTVAGLSTGHWCNGHCHAQ